MVLVLMLLSWAAVAADWLAIQGTERDDDALHLLGFVQVGVEAGVFNGDAAAPPGHRGETPIFNASPTPTLSIRRARLIARGAVPDAHQRASWLIALEAGQNGLTRASPVVLADASTTLRAAPWLHLRAGKFKLPVMEEALQGHPIAGDFISFSEPVRTLVMENTIVDGAYVGGASGFRDLGLEAFGPVGHGTVRGTYALMASNGGASLDADLDLTGRLSVAWLAADSNPYNPHREEVSAWVWRQQGHRDVDGARVARVRQGAGAQIERGTWRVLAEVVHARGAIEVGASPPFPGATVVVDGHGAALGAALTARADLGQVMVTGRWSAVWRHPDDPAADRVLSTLTPGLGWKPYPRVRWLANYEWRTLTAPNADPATQALVASMGDRILVESLITF